LGGGSRKGGGGVYCSKARLFRVRMSQCLEAGINGGVWEVREGGAQKECKGGGGGEFFLVRYRGVGRGSRIAGEITKQGRGGGFPNRKRGSEDGEQFVLEPRIPGVGRGGEWEPLMVVGGGVP